MYENIICKIAALSFMLIIAVCSQGCGPSEKTRVIDARAGTESEAVTLTLQRERRSYLPKEEAERAKVGLGSIIAITSDVEFYSVTVQVNHPITSGLLTTYNQNSSQSGSAVAIAQVTSTSSTLVFESENGGFINAMTNVKDELKYDLYLDTRGLDGQSVTTSITQIGVRVGNDRTLRTLDVTGTNNTFFVGEPPLMTGSAVQTSYSYGGRGTNQEVALFELSNGSTKYSATAYEIFVVSNASQLNLRLTDNNGNVIATAKDDLSGGYRFSVSVGDEPKLVLAPMKKRTYRLIADPQGASFSGNELRIQVSSLEARSASNVVKFINTPIRNNGVHTSFLTNF